MEKQKLSAAATQKWYKHKIGSSKRKTKKKMFPCSLPQVFPSSVIPFLSPLSLFKIAADYA